MSHFRGKAKLNIPTRTQSGTTFRLKRKGLPSLQGRGQGDQYVEVLASLPKSLSSEERKSFKIFNLFEMIIR